MPGLRAVRTVAPQRLGTTAHGRQPAAAGCMARVLAQKLPSRRDQRDERDVANPTAREEEPLRSQNRQRPERDDEQHRFQ